MSKIVAISGDEPHPSWGGWEAFIAACERRDSVGEGDDEVAFYGITNCNYIIFPGGRLVQNFGYHGKALMNRVRREGWKDVLSDIDARHKEVREAVRKLKQWGNE